MFQYGNADDYLPYHLIRTYEICHIKLDFKRDLFLGYQEHSSCLG